MVLAESMILISGKFDLSLESIAGFAPAIGVLVVIPAAYFGFGFELPTWVGLLVIPLAGAVIGVVNGLLIVGLRLNAFIVTLAMLIICCAACWSALTSGKTLFDLPDAFFVLG